MAILIKHHTNNMEVQKKGQRQRQYHTVETENIIKFIQIIFKKLSEKLTKFLKNRNKLMKTDSARH